MEGQDKVKVTCKNFPEISATGNSEQSAIHLAQRKVTEAAEKAEIGTH